MKTHSDIITALGGPKAVAQWLSERGLSVKPNAVSNWRKRGIPPLYRPALRVLAKSMSVDVGIDFVQGEIKKVMKDGSKLVVIPCEHCGEEISFHEGSPEAMGVFRVFCRDKDCEDFHTNSRIMEGFQ